MFTSADDQGNDYYYNATTDESMWTEPPGYQELNVNSGKDVVVGGHGGGGDAGGPPNIPLPATPASAGGAPALPPMRAGATMRGAGDSPYAAPEGNYDSVKPSAADAGGPDEVKLKSFVQSWAGPQSNELLTNATRSHPAAVDPRTVPGATEYADYSTSGDKEKSHHSYQYVPFQVVIEGVDVYVALNKKKTIRDCFVQIEAQYSCAFRDRQGVKVQAMRNSEGDVVALTDLAGSFPAYSKFTADTTPESASEERDKSTDLDFRTKRKVKIHTMAGDTKTIMVDDGATASIVMSQVAAKMGLINHEEFWLFVVRDPSSTLAKTRAGAGKSKDAGKRRSSSETRTFRKSNSQGNLALQRVDSDPALLDSTMVVCWLKADESLSAQGIKMTETVYLKRRFFFLDDTVYINDPVCLKLIYMQARQTILSGEVECSEPQAVSLAALQLQISKGDQERSQFSKEDQMAHFIHESHTKKDSRRVKEAIYDEWAKLKGIKPENAEYLYVKLYNTLPMWGITTFNGKVADGKKKKIVPMLLGVSRTEILKIDPKSRTVETRWE